MKELEEYKNKIKKLNEEYGYKYYGYRHYDITYFKKAIDLLQCSIYLIFPDEICYQLALLQTSLTDDLSFYYKCSDYEYFIGEEVITTNLTIQDLMELIKILRDINNANYISKDITDLQKTRINHFLYSIFNICRIYIEEKFLKENKVCDGCNIIKKIAYLRDNCNFNEFVTKKEVNTENDEDNNDDNKYSLNTITFFDDYISKFFENSLLRPNSEKIQVENEKMLRSHKNFIDDILLGGYPIIDENILHIEEIWHLKNKSKNNWEYFQLAFEYLRTITVQLFSKNLMGDGEFEERLINALTDGIVFCFSRGKIKRNTIGGIATDFCNYVELISGDFIIAQYFYDNLKYLWKSFNSCTKFSSDEKKYMLNCIDDILSLIDTYLE